MKIIVVVPDAVTDDVERLWPADTWNAVIARALRLIVDHEHQARLAAERVYSIDRNAA